MQQSPVSCMVHVSQQEKACWGGGGLHDGSDPRLHDKG
jgi:hypothetical protein